MSKKKKRKDVKRTSRVKHDLLFEIYGIAMIALAVISLANLGAIGRNLTYLSRFLVGTWDFLIPIVSICLALYIMIKRRWPQNWTPKMTGVLMILLCTLGFVHFNTFQYLQAAGKAGPVMDTTWNLLINEYSSRLPTDIGGGMIGGLIYGMFHFLFDDVGTVIVLSAFLLAGILLVFGISYIQFLQKLYVLFQRQRASVKKNVNSILEKNAKAKGQKKQSYNREAEGDPHSEFKEELESSSSSEPTIAYYYEPDPIPDMELVKKPKQLTLSLKSTSEMNPESPGNQNDGEDVVVKFHTTERLDHYKIPPSTILRALKNRDSLDVEDLKSKASKLEETLENFGVKAKVNHVQQGPAVTRYEIQPKVGVKVSQIVRLSNDIALALAAKSIRIEAPIPGKAAIGIEVPNSETAMVGLRDVIDSTGFQKNPSKLSIGLGKDISGEAVIANLAQMPHLLVAGATGAGKSVCVNGIIISLLYKARPDEVKLMMIDPKMVELNIYNGIPHLLVPVVTDARKAAIALKKVVSEMEKRYELFAKNGARDLERYNQLARDRSDEAVMPILPYIVVIVDELADLMMVAPGDVEDAICRLAQMARAAGIHMILATQRPSVDVITGVIKANIPSRIAFTVSSQADSRTILDMGGAEKLLGRGDMLYMPIGAPKPIRVQGTFVTDEEVESVVNFVKNQQEVHYNEEMIPDVPENVGADLVDDDMYPQAVQLVLEARTASVSLLQRRLRVGYTRAARLIDLMEARGIVGPYEGSKPREVLVTEELIQEISNT
ncbi:DNA segregation ATPase FtsK/SpoIIIE, S-DNA-T family [Thermoactinomyces sp. DSM 45891]|uniref:FtsK/SpoIIIE family DNA translocase n=1 Tax=Thermoactinomyces sp. DSM 45891 TaxID=1761907 RepID=UPI00091D5029|nr:DNA translocase FtsK [Thermoactinomyces sp. DSM 45891]SFX34603.1 DNA segregation ATPase FtsK/SpoIIIE, S-DNA-T family [Thermoactinomyces sp. DSM 45891]